MHAVTVNKDQLLGVLRENRDKHRSIFIEAQQGYREAVIHELDSMLADAKAGKKIQRAITLREPVDQTADYDRVIRMMEMSVDTEIDLEEHEFNMYVLDEWSWKQNFTASNYAYSTTLQGSNASFDDITDSWCNL